MAALRALLVCPPVCPFATYRLLTWTLKGEGKTKIGVNVPFDRSSSCASLNAKFKKNCGGYKVKVIWGQKCLEYGTYLVWMFARGSQEQRMWAGAVVCSGQ